MSLWSFFCGDPLRGVDLRRDPRFTGSGLFPQAQTAPAETYRTIAEVLRGHAAIAARQRAGDADDRGETP